MTDLVQRLRGIAERQCMPTFNEAADRIEALERENAELRHAAGTMQIALGGLKRENAELRKDAERYRWLFTGDKVYARFLEAYHLWDGSDGKTGFDAAIDEAMKE